MQNLIEQFIQTAKDAGKQTITHGMIVDVKSGKTVENVIRAWGEELKTSRGAPSWSNVELFIQDIDRAKSAMRMIADQDGKGAIEFTFSQPQLESLAELKTMLGELATKVGADQANIAFASAAFEKAVEQAQFTETFDVDMGSLAVASLLEKTAELQLVVTHERFGELDAKALVSLSKIKAPAVLEGDPTSDDAIAAQMPREMALPDRARYKTMGQMVKASDAKALKDYVEKAKEQGYWDEDKINACSQLGWAAAAEGSVDTMTVLLEKGSADIDYSDKRGLTPLAAACANNHPAMIDFLLSRGADPCKTPIDGRSLLMLAAAHDAIDAIRVLKTRGFDLEEKSLDGRTALHYAALGEDDKTATGAVKTLIELGANPTFIDDIGDDGGCLPEDYVDEESDVAYGLLSQYRKDWEAGRTGPQKALSSTIGKARSLLGF